MALTSRVLLSAMSFHVAPPSVLLHGTPAIHRRDGESSGFLTVEAQAHVTAALAVRALVGRDVGPLAGSHVKLPHGAVTHVVGAPIVAIGDVERRAVVGEADGFPAAGGKQHGGAA